MWVLRALAIKFQSRTGRAFSAICLVAYYGASISYGAFTAFNSASTHYTGLVGTRSKIPASYDTSNNQMMSRTFFYTRTAVTSLQVRFACWYENTSSNVESSPGSNCVIKGDVEYPVGVCHPLTFSGMSSATVTAGSDVLSDTVSVTIPTNTQAWIGEYLTNASGLVLSDILGDTSTGDAINVGVSGITDRTVTCTSVPNSGGFQSFPLAVIGQVPNTQASVCLLGDSLVEGAHDTYSGSSGEIGILARSVGPTLGYINMGVSGDSSTRFNASHTQRIKLLPYCTSTISGYGHNNFANDGESLSTMETSLATMYGTVAANMFGSSPTIIQTTIIPWTTSTDSWATTVNQTVTAFQTSVAGYNTDLLAATVGPLGGSYNTSSVLGTGTNNSLWIITPSPPYTPDGVHPAPVGYALIQSSAIIDTSRLH